MQNPLQQKRPTASKNVRLKNTSNNDLKNISISKTIRSTRYTLAAQLKASCIPEQQNMIKSSATSRKIPSKNQFQFVDTNINIDNNSIEDLKLNEDFDKNNTNESDIKLEKNEMGFNLNQDQIEHDDTVTDVFANLADSNISSEEDEDENRYYKFLFSKKAKFICEICYKIFENQSIYDRHINWIHQNKELLYLCARCPKSLNSLSELVNHTKEHKAQTKRIIMCDICGIQKKNKYFMDDHIRMHLKELAFICHICTASFNTKNSLKKHLHRHTGIKKYKCDQCDVAFFDCSDYKRHLAKHGGIEKEFHCSICGNSFYERKLLRHHIIKVHNICNGEELRFLPEPRYLNTNRFKFLQRPTRIPKENIIKKQPTKISKPKTVEKQPKPPKSSKKRKNLAKPKLIGLEINSENVNNDQEFVENVNKDESEIKEEMHIEDDTFHQNDVETNELVVEPYENPEEEENCEYKNIPEFDEHSTLSKCISHEGYSKKPEDIKFIDIISKLNETEKTVYSSLNNVEESLQLINLSAGSFKFNEGNVQFIHHKISKIVAEIQKRIQQISQKILKQENDNITQFLPLNDIDTLDQKLSDTTFNDEFTKVFETCYPQTSPHNLEDIENILSRSFLEQHSVRGAGNRGFIHHKRLMKTLHKIWQKECRTYKEFEKLMRSQVWKVMRTYKKKHKAQQK